LFYSILLFCNNQIGLVVTILFHLFHPHNTYRHIDNIIFTPIHKCITLIKVMQMHYIILLLCNTHAQDNIFHLTWFKNAIILVLCNTLMPRLYFISSNWTIQYLMDTLIISYPTQFTHALPSSRRCNTLRTKYKYHI